MENNCISIDQSALTYGQMIFIMLGLVPAFFCVPCWAVGKFIYEPMKKNAKIDEKEWKIIKQFTRNKCNSKLLLLN